MKTKMKNKKHWRKRQRQNKLIINAIMVLMLASVILVGFTNQSTALTVVEPEQAVNLPVNEDKRLVAEFVGNVSAYTLGRVEETDDTPCIGASGEDMCAMAKNGMLMFANNYYKLGTTVCIDTVGCGIVKDRMNKRYGKEHFDIAGLDLKKNLQFGRQNLIVRVYKK